MKKLTDLAERFNLSEEKKQNLLKVITFKEMMKMQNKPIEEKIDEYKRRATSEIVNVLLTKIRSDENLKCLELLLSPVIFDVVLESLNINDLDYVQQHKDFDLEISKLKYFGYKNSNEVVDLLNKAWSGYAVVQGKELIETWRFWIKL